MKKCMICILLLLCIVFTASIYRIANNYETACSSFVNTGLKGNISKNINMLISEELSNGKWDYSTFAKINYSGENLINSIIVDTLKISIIANDFAVKLYNSIEERDNTYSFPLGNAMGLKYFSGKGPQIKVTLLPLGDVQYKINSNLSESGLNQTVHRITIEFFMNINCVAPFHEKSLELKFEIVISEILIAGKIPNVILSS